MKSQGYIPKPRAPKGSQVKVPYTFVGGKQFWQSDSMRVIVNGNTEKNKEISRALKPAEIAMDMIVSRFGIFQFKHSLLMDGKLLQCVFKLHNFFLKTNPAYADLGQLVSMA